MKRIFIALVLSATTAAGLFASIPQASAGNCDYSYQSDKNGNACGGRAADQRRGGKY